MRSGPARLSSLLAIMLAAGCSSDSGGGDYSQYLQAVRQAFGGDGNTLTVEKVGTIPFATIGYRIGDRPQQILVLATDNGEQRLWTSSERIVLITNAGRILSSAGLQHNASLSGTNISAPAVALTREYTNYLTADFADVGKYSVSIVCLGRRAGAEAVSILGQQLSAIRINETCNAASIGWAYTNSYWVAEDGSEVWRSIQHIHPALASIVIETFRPAE